MKFILIVAGSLILLASMVDTALAKATDARLLVDEGFESGKLPFRPSGNSPEVLQAPDARAGKYVMKSELNESSKDPMRTEVEVVACGPTVNFDVRKEYWAGISIKQGIVAC